MTARPFPTAMLDLYGRPLLSLGPNPDSPPFFEGPHPPPSPFYGLPSTIPLDDAIPYPFPYKQQHMPSAPAISLADHAQPFLDRSIVHPSSRTMFRNSQAPFGYLPSEFQPQMYLQPQQMLKDSQYGGWQQQAHERASNEMIVANPTISLPLPSQYQPQSYLSSHLQSIALIQPQPSLAGFEPKMYLGDPACVSRAQQRDDVEQSQFAAEICQPQMTDSSNDLAPPPSIDTLAQSAVPLAGFAAEFIHQLCFPSATPSRPTIYSRSRNNSAASLARRSSNSPASYADQHHQVYTHGRQDYPGLCDEVEDEDEDDALMGPLTPMNSYSALWFENAAALEQEMMLARRFSPQTINPNSSTSPSSYSRQQQPQPFLSEEQHSSLPTQEFRTFTYRALAQTLLTPTALVLALFYARRLSTFSGDIWNDPELAPKHLLIVSLQMANKVLDDNVFTARTWADITQIPLLTLNAHETWSYMCCHFNLKLDDAEWLDWLYHLRARESQLDFTRMDPVNVGVGSQDRSDTIASQFWGAGLSIKGVARSAVDAMIAAFQDHSAALSVESNASKAMTSFPLDNVALCERPAFCPPSAMLQAVYDDRQFHVPSWGYDESVRPAASNMAFIHQESDPRFAGSAAATKSVDTRHWQSFEDFHEPSYVAADLLSSLDADGPLQNSYVRSAMQRYDAHQYPFQPMAY